MPAYSLPVHNGNNPKWISKNGLFIALALGVLTLYGLTLSSRATGQTASAGTPALDIPLLTTWFTQNSGRYARVVETRGGKPVAVWPSPGLPNRGGGQSQPAYSDVQQVSYSGDYVYVKGTGLASHQMGPWYMDLNQIFGNWPSNENYTRRFPIHPQAAAKKITNGLGPLGLWVNGVALFNLLDGAYYDPTTQREPHGAPGALSSGIWVRNAVVVEQPTFDKSNAHQPPSGTYHYHDNPVALRYQLNDNIAYNAATDNYTEDTSRLHHSPILGWSYDGYPIYGPYGYADPKNPASEVRRMVSGYVARDGSHHTTDLRKTGRQTLAKWAADLHNTKVQLDKSQYGPAVSERYTLGRYVEDFDYLGDLDGAQGKDFDLDLYNGRFGVTPDFPNGTYAYFVTIQADGSPAFPYVIGRQWNGVPGGGEARRISEPVTLYREAGPKTKIVTQVTSLADGKQIQWTSVEGGSYKIEGTTDSSKDGSQWEPVTERDVPGSGLSTIYKVPVGSPAAAFQRFRVTLTTLSPYDTTGRRSGPGMGGPGGPRRPNGQGGPPGFGGPGGPGGPGGQGPGGPEGGPPLDGKVDTVTPMNAKRGETVTLKFTITDRPPPAFVKPQSVKIGAITARQVTWDGTTVTAVFEIPATLMPGAITVRVVFPGPPGSQGTVPFTLQDGFTVR